MSETMKTPLNGDELETVWLKILALGRATTEDEAEKLLGHCRSTVERRRQLQPFSGLMRRLVTEGEKTMSLLCAWKTPRFVAIASDGRPRNENGNFGYPRYGTLETNMSD